MPYIIATGTACAEYACPQEDVQQLVEQLFPIKPHEMKRLLPIFEHAQVEERQFAQPLAWYKKKHGLKERNDLYVNKALQYSLEAVRNCMSQAFGEREFDPSLIDHIIFVSSTGIATPTLDAYIMNELHLKESIKRTPLFGLGCAGGTSGVAKAYEWLLGHPDACVLVVCVELCSLTFQLEDATTSNFVGTALFGDGASAALVTGDGWKQNEQVDYTVPSILSSSSKTKWNSEDVMGWRVVDNGFEVIFKKSIPRLVKDFWSVHVDEVLAQHQWNVSELPFLVAHPGGKKVLEAYEEVLHVEGSVLNASRNVLARHGNMSSPTVHFVLERIMEQRPERGTRSLMTSLGPGFSSEIISLEWV
ncbi:naringenin-chalcone synthase [Halobacillus litoralis]|uniref:Naringenin-chalcone synthase n=1 Tax=Halobacillus litoralis TaxID=45668 RepID=A0A845DS57_9BACI|nr:3-oxoacyl-[acyl-carrier-protein] synthase III C-terminal domain-containing protein [Halobacillus litoralis]MYL19375.1 naringenin-chalcone synthase [Halobacillus litoralis]MYL38049.1 naringenin-chalcone synthase [Halobacillus litoralis]